jgi:endonuclease YncB( thermonuclease family)
MPCDFLQIARLLIRSTALILLAAFSQFLQEVLPKDFAGKAIGFLDGDTIEVLHNNRAERIRLNGIDCTNYSQVAPHNRVAFNSAAEAEAAGYRVAGNCP